jgi:hypothetical protein
MDKWSKFSREHQNYYILNADVNANAQTTTGLKNGICFFWNEVIGNKTR